MESDSLKSESKLKFCCCSGARSMAFLVQNWIFFTREEEEEEEVGERNYAYLS